MTEKNRFLKDDQHELTEDAKKRRKTLAWDWRGELRQKKQKVQRQFTDALKAQFLTEFAASERFYDSARACGVAAETVRRHLKEDPEFAEAFAEARERYRDRVYAQRNKALFDGYEKPHIGGKDKDEIVAVEKQFPHQVLLKELARLNPEYRDKAEIDMNMKGGVLVVPGRSHSMDDWAKRLEELKRQQAEGEDGSA